MQGRGTHHAAAPAACPCPQATVVLLSVVLIMISGAARVRNLYNPSVSTNDCFYYTLIVLPELLQQLLTMVPT